MISESSINEILKVLKLDPSSCTQAIYAATNNSTALKDCITADINAIIKIFGRPSPTQTRTTPKKIYEHICKLEKDITKLTNELSLIKETMSDKENSSEINQEITRILRESTIAQLGISPGLLGWDAQYPIDAKIENAFNALNALLPCFDIPKILSRDRIPKRGESTSNNTSENLLIFYLCTIYKHYTGKIPMAWDAFHSAGTGVKVYGGIIPYLQIILPYTEYGATRSLTDLALQQKLERLRKSRKYGNLFQNQ
ncbi:MAG: hypothetical protein H6864_04995 [Micavibrio sp.]|nr:hypothetical protein [Micavibrio sp.]